MDDSPNPQRLRPDGTGDAAVEAAGRMTEALETLERARGHLFSFHQLIGEADLSLDDVLGALRRAGADELAQRIDHELLGRNVIAERWTFQIIEDFEDGYYASFREHERAVRDELTGGRRHVYEAEMKEARRTHGHPDHTAGP